MTAINYRLKIQVVDEEQDEVVATLDQPLQMTDEDNVPQIYRVLRDFNKKREEHEGVYYPQEVTE